MLRGRGIFFFCGGSSFGDFFGGEVSGMEEGKGFASLCPRCGGGVVVVVVFRTR